MKSEPIPNPPLVGAVPVSKSACAAVWALWSLPWVLMAATFLMAPGYATPLLNNPVARPVVIILLVWESAGCLLLSRFRHPLVWIAVVLLFILPAVLIPMMLPAVITIMQALGPVFSK